MPVATLLVNVATDLGTVAWVNPDNAEGNPDDVVATLTGADPDDGIIRLAFPNPSTVLPAGAQVSRVYFGLRHAAITGFNINTLTFDNSAIARIEFYSDYVIPLTVLGVVQWDLIATAGLDTNAKRIAGSPYVEIGSLFTNVVPDTIQIDSAYLEFTYTTGNKRRRDMRRRRGA